MLLQVLRAHFGTVSGITETSGVIMVRNITARKRAVLMAENYGYIVTDKTSGAFPRLVTVAQGGGQ